LYKTRAVELDDVMQALKNITRHQDTDVQVQKQHLVRLPYNALADQKHGCRQCQRAWEGPQHAQKAKFLNLQFKDRGKIKLTTTFSGNIVELNLKKARIRILPFASLASLDGRPSAVGSPFLFFYLLVL
jgi:hypothetical protein